jgi:hypothetical protein
MAVIARWCIGAWHDDWNANVGATAMTDHANQADSVARMHGFDASKPNVARIYDYLLGGKDNFAADRHAAQRLIEELPNAATVAKANRVFLAAAVRQVARDGVAQYVDIGAGLPTSPSVHECARAVIPGARVVYVDNDPVAVTHGQALLETGDGVIAIEGDAHKPEAILADSRLARLIDLSEPVCVLLVSMLHFLTAGEADTIVSTFRQRIAPGSYLVISQGTANGPAPREGVRNVYGRETILTGRPAAEIAAYFDGFDLVTPGLVPVAEWPVAEPDARLPQRQPARPASPGASMLAGVGRKRTAASRRLPLASGPRSRSCIPHSAVPSSRIAGIITLSSAQLACVSAGAVWTRLRSSATARSAASRLPHRLLTGHRPTRLAPAPREMCSMILSFLI